MINIDFVREVGYLNYVLRTLARQFSKRILKVDNKIVLPNKIEMILPKDSHFASEIYVTKCSVDWGSEALLLHLLEPDKIFLDVGANIGYYSLLASPYVEKVYAFEPDPRNIKHLYNNCNRVTNIELVQKGIYSENTNVKFDASGDSEVSRIVIDNQNYDSINIEVTTIDTFLKSLEGQESSSITAIKTDIEGYDFHALTGAKKTIQKDQPLILSEFFEISEDIFRFCEEIGYELYAFAKLIDSNLNKKKQSKTLFNFVQINRLNIDRYRYKMIFLVPPRLRDFFQRLLA